MFSSDNLWKTLFSFNLIWTNWKSISCLHVQRSYVLIGMCMSLAFMGEGILLVLLSRAGQNLKKKGFRICYWMLLSEYWIGIGSSLRNGGLRLIARALAILPGLLQMRIVDLGSYPLLCRDAVGFRGHILCAEPLTLPSMPSKKTSDCTKSGGKSKGGVTCS